MHDWRAIWFRDTKEYFTDFWQRVYAGDPHEALGIDKRDFLLTLAYGMKKLMACKCISMIM